MSGLLKWRFILKFFEKCGIVFCSEIKTFLSRKSIWKKRNKKFTMNWSIKRNMRQRVESASSTLANRVNFWSTWRRCTRWKHHLMGYSALTNVASVDSCRHFTPVCFCLISLKNCTKNIFNDFYQNFIVYLLLHSLQHCNNKSLRSKAENKILNFFNLSDHPFWKF